MWSFEKSYFLGLLPMCVFLMSCMVLPVPPEFTPYSRVNVDEGTVEEILIGRMTKEDVLMKLGEPDFESERGNFLEYHWTKVVAVLVTAGYGPGSDIIKHYKLTIEFDKKGVAAKVVYKN